MMQILKRYLSKNKIYGNLFKVVIFFYFLPTVYKQ